MNKFVDRPLDMVELEHALLLQQHNRRQKIFVLHGLGGIGKTQLAVDFARRHHRRFSSVFWLDGRSEDSLKRSIANCANRIPKGQISEKSQNYISSGEGNIDLVMENDYKWILLGSKGCITGFYYENSPPCSKIMRLGITSDNTHTTTTALTPQYHICEIPPIAGPNAGLFLSVAILSGFEKVNLCRVLDRCTGILIHYVNGLMPA
jgi:hypothetical protein